MLALKNRKSMAIPKAVPLSHPHDNPSLLNYLRWCQWNNLPVIVDIHILLHVQILDKVLSKI